jgi:hypothetical protein
MAGAGDEEYSTRQAVTATVLADFLLAGTEMEDGTTNVPPQGVDYAHHETKTLTHGIRSLGHHAAGRSPHSAGTGERRESASAGDFDASRNPSIRGGDRLPAAKNGKTAVGCVMVEGAWHPRTRFALRPAESACTSPCLLPKNRGNVRSLDQIPASPPCESACF